MNAKRQNGNKLMGAFLCWGEETLKPPCFSRYTIFLFLLYTQGLWKISTNFNSIYTPQKPLHLKSPSGGRPLIGTPSQQNDSPPTKPSAVLCFDRFQGPPQVDRTRAGRAARSNVRKAPGPALLLFRQNLLPLLGTRGITPNRRPQLGV